MLNIRFFKSYSPKAKELEDMLKNSLQQYIKDSFGIECKLHVHDSKGLSVKEGNAPYQVLSAALSNDIVLIDGSIEEDMLDENGKPLPIGINYDSITPAVSSLDNILLVSRTPIPLNFIPCRSNVAFLGEKDESVKMDNGEMTRFHGEERQNGFFTYTNEQILLWLKHEFTKMHLNKRLLRDGSLKIDMNLPVDELMSKELLVMKENTSAVDKEKDRRKKIFISYRTHYCPRPDDYGNIVNSDECKYNGLYSIEEVAKAIVDYHKQQGDAKEWTNEPFYYPHGVLSNEFMPEIRRWAFVAIPDRKIRECDEFWIFNTKYKPADEKGKGGEVSYWDSWWCLGEFLTIVRMKYANQLKPGFKVMLFNPDNENPIEELPLDKIPAMTDEENRELARYFANGDFLEAGLESMVNVRKRRKWSKLRRYLYFTLMKKFVWPRMAQQGDFENYPFKHFEESTFSHVYDDAFEKQRILECQLCKKQGRTMQDILSNNNLIWDFLNINNYYSDRKLHNVDRRDGIIKMSDIEIQDEMNKNICSCMIECKKKHSPCFSKKCEREHKSCISKSEKCFYIFWTPRMGRHTGPNNCVIEKVDIYEVVNPIC